MASLTAIVQAYNAKTGDKLWGVPDRRARRTARLPPIGMDGKDYVAMVAGAVCPGRSRWTARSGPLPGAACAPPTESQFAGRIFSTNQVQISNEIENNGIRADLKYVDEYALKPVRTKIKVGESVTWTNTGKVVHTPTDRGGAWTAGAIQPGQTATVKFDKPGNYTYFDKDHPWSVGQLIVE